MKQGKLVAVEAMPEGTFLAQYTGEVLTKEEMDRVLGLGSQDSDITEEDWDRMETLAEEERLSLDGEQNENRIKLNKFRENPKVDISKSRLADELKLILEEAKKRISIRKIWSNQ